MRPTVLVALMVFALMASGCASDAAGDAREPDSSSIPAVGDPDLAALATSAVAAHGLPALAIARVSLDSGATVGVAGTRSHGDATPLTIDSRFHLGSDTKAMTAVLVAQLVEAGALSLDAPIGELLPVAAVDPSRSAVTVRDVLGHRSGLVDDLDLPALHAASDAVAARREAAFEAFGSSGGQPGSFRYANVNYMLAGVLVEEMTGKSWTAVIQERIFDPLGMSSCGFGAPPGDLDPLGHDAGGRPVPQDAAVTDNPPAMGPAGTVHCSVGDWGKFATAMLGALTGTDTEILGAAAAADLFSGSESYVAGWLRSERSGEVSYGHDGSNTLWYARAVLRPAHRDALLLASNSGEDAAIRAIDELTNSLLQD